MTPRQTIQPVVSLVHSQIPYQAHQQQKKEDRQFWGSMPYFETVFVCHLLWKIARPPGSEGFLFKGVAHFGREKVAKRPPYFERTPNEALLSSHQLGAQLDAASTAGYHTWHVAQEGDTGHMETTDTQILTSIGFFLPSIGFFLHNLR